MKYTRALFTALPALFLLINTGPVPGAEGVRSVAAVRTQTPPVIDGRLDDECWSRANMATGDTIHLRLERTNQIHG
jgi:hypothetical protein